MTVPSKAALRLYVRPSVGSHGVPSMPCLSALGCAYGDRSHASQWQVWRHMCRHPLSMNLYSVLPVVALGVLTAQCQGVFHTNPVVFRRSPYPTGQWVLHVCSTITTLLPIRCVRNSVDPFPSWLKYPPGCVQQLHSLQGHLDNMLVAMVSRIASGPTRKMKEIHLCRFAFSSCASRTYFWKFSCCAAL